MKLKSELPGCGGARGTATVIIVVVTQQNKTVAAGARLAVGTWQSGLDALLEMAARARTAMMCSELLWWRCHRSLLSDVLKARGFEVLHLTDTGPAKPHPWTAPARLVEGRLDYSAPGQVGDLFG